MKVFSVRRLAQWVPILGMMLPAYAATQTPAPPKTAVEPIGEYSHSLDAIKRKVNSLLMMQRFGDIAVVEEVKFTSLPGRSEIDTAPGAGNPLIIAAYTMVPKGLGSRKAPLIVFPHGGFHSDFAEEAVDEAANALRELLLQGYAIIAPDYRGSTGRGKDFYDQIDYGGKEIDDTHAAREWAIENMPNADAGRVGIVAWSHGGFHALLNVMRWPQDYKVAYAGVPVSDLVQRMAYEPADYHDQFASFIGKKAYENPMEYRKRSPVYHADKLETPLLIHTNTNDEDVNVMEVEGLINALKAHGKKFEYKIYEDAPGGHLFNRIDTRLAKESRREIYEFLARYLHPRAP